jgi:hypothetical protein
MAKHYQVNDPPLKAVAFNIAPRRCDHTILFNQTVAFDLFLDTALVLLAIGHTCVS